MQPPKRPFRGARAPRRLILAAAVVLWPFASGASTELESQVVTATRQPTAVERLPASSLVLSGDQLEAEGRTDLSVAAESAPNVRLDATPTNTYFVIRGLSTGEVRSAEQSVGLFIDGVYFGRPQLALFDLLDTEQIEILRGPQGALLGKNTIAGAVNIRTRQPTRWQEASLLWGGGTLGERRVVATLNAPWSEAVAMRLAGSVQDDKGYLFNTTLARSDLARPGGTARASLVWQPDGDTRWQLSLLGGAIRQQGDGFQLIEASDSQLALFRRFDAMTEDDPSDRRTSTDNRRSRGDIDGGNVLLHGDWRAWAIDFSVIAAFASQDTVADFDADFSPIPLLSFPSQEDYDQYSIEWRGHRSLGPVEVTGGVYAFRSRLDLDVAITALPEGIDAIAGPVLLGPDQDDEALGGALRAALDALIVDPIDGVLTDRSRHALRQDTRTLSAFSSTAWTPFDSLTLRADLRYTTERKDGDLSLRYDNGGLFFRTLLNETPYALQDTVRLDVFTPQLSMVVQPAPGRNGYLTAARAFKSGGFNNLAANAEQATFERESAETLELGMRWRSSRFPVRAGLTAFHTRFANLQVAVFDGVQFFVDNAASATSQGLEAEFGWRPGLGLDIRLHGAYLDARYDRFENAPAPAGSDEDTQDLSGERLVRAPRFSGHLDIAHTRLLSAQQWRLRLAAQLQTASRQFLNLDLDPVHARAGFAQLHLQAQLASIDDRVSLSLIARNVTDRVLRREAAALPVFGDGHFGSNEAPRQYLVRLGLRF